MKLLIGHRNHLAFLTIAGGYAGRGTGFLPERPPLAAPWIGDDDHC